MGRRLRVSAGPSLEQLAPITVNTFQPHRISSDLFEGQVVAHIKNFSDEHGDVLESEYFSREDRQGVTWSIQVQGRFLVPYSADDILFGNTFDRPLKLPWGTAAVLRFMKYIDPTLEHDLQSQTKPWALSPLISTMPHFAHRRISSLDELHPEEFPGPHHHSLVDDTSELYLAAIDRHHHAGESDGSSAHSSSSSSSSGSSGSSSSSPSSPITPSSRRAASPAPSTCSSMSYSSSSTMSSFVSRSTSSSSKLREVMKKALSVKSKRHRARAGAAGAAELKFVDATQRRTYFSSPEKRKQIEFGPMDVITTDFCYGFMSFTPSLSLQLPGGLSFDLMRYWEGQPVRFVCCERKSKDAGEEGVDGSTPWGRIFWCVAIEVIEEEEEKDEDEEKEEEVADIDSAAEEIYLDEAELAESLDEG